MKQRTLKRTILFALAAGQMTLWSHAGDGTTLMDLSEPLPVNRIESTNAVVKQTAEGLRVSVAADKEGSVILRPEGQYWDITQWVFLTVNIENSGPQETRFETGIFGDNPRRTDGDPTFEEWHVGWVKPNELRSFNCVSIRHGATAEDYAHYGLFKTMQGIPNGITLISWKGIDASRIRHLEIRFPAAAFDRTVLLKSIAGTRPAIPELLKKDPDHFFPFINKYGQYKHATWPGKITSDAQLAQDAEKELKQIEQIPASPEWNQFGGYNRGPQLTATGHFRAEKIKNQWWIVDPLGKLFWSTGSNGAGLVPVSTPIDGREHYFEELPAEDSPLAPFMRRNSYSFASANLFLKYGEDYRFKSAQLALRRMRSWGLNTLGGWSYENVPGQPEQFRLPYTILASIKNPPINEKFPDVFDPEWKANVEKTIKSDGDKVKDDPYFFGFFVNNELHWDDPDKIAQSTMKKDGSCVGKQVYVALLKERLTDIAVLNERVETVFASWEELLTTPVTNGMNVEGVGDLNIEHYKKMCDNYFRITSEAIHKYAPNKMYIGCRWHSTMGNEYNIPIAAKYVDILSFNLYRNEIDAFDYPGAAVSVDKPFIASEFNFGALDSGKFFTGLGYASDQRNRGEKYRHFVRGAMRNNKCVGAHWFTWMDTPTTGNRRGKNANSGLLAETDQYYSDLIDVIRETTHSMYEYRTGNR